MIYRRQRFSIIGLLLLLLLTISSCKHTPAKPIVEYDSEKSTISIIQTDTAAHDSAYISIDDLYDDKFPIIDTISFSIKETLNKIDKVSVAYKLLKQNYSLKISFRTTRTSDTTYLYRYTPFEIKSINVADVLSGKCLGLYDVNYKRDYHERIRQWIFKNHIVPDSAIIENINSLLKQFYYSGKNEYGALSGSVPIVTKLSDLKFRFKAQLPGEYFYLFAFPSKSGLSIPSFVESKIAKGLTDAKHSLNDEFICSNKGGSGPNVLFLIGIDHNWKYEALPVGIIAIDDIAPSIITTGNRDYDFRKRFGNNNYDNAPTLFWSNKVTLKKQNILINIPNLSSGISSSVTISYGNFQGNEYFGFNIPFYLTINGDVKTISIGSHIIDGSSVKNGECMRLSIKGLHIGDNVLPLSAVDSRGNKSTSSLSIPIAAIRNNHSYYDNDNDYDELEERISELEDKISDLEN